jgi:hypothetical protein
MVFQPRPISAFVFVGDHAGTPSLPTQKQVTLARDNLFRLKAALLLSALGRTRSVPTKSPTKHLRPSALGAERRGVSAIEISKLEDVSCSTSIRSRLTQASVNRCRGQRLRWIHARITGGQLQGLGATGGYESCHHRSRQWHRGGQWRLRTRGRAPTCS